MSQAKETPDTPISAFLGPAPATFAPVNVEFIAPDGRKLTIPKVAFLYRDRAAYAAWMDEREAASKALNDGSPSDDTYADAFTRVNRHNTETVLQMVQGWALPNTPVDAANVSDLVTKAPAAFAALWTAYTAAARDGRLGN